MTLAVELTDVTNFWIPVAGIVPTIAIGLILEARFGAASWTLEKRWTRTIQALAWFSAAFLLVIVESVALSRMSRPPSANEDLTIYVLALLFAFMLTVLAPAVALFNRGIADTDYLVSRWLRRKLSFARRREVNSIEKDLNVAEEHLFQAWQDFSAGTDEQELSVDADLRAGLITEVAAQLNFDDIRTARRVNSRKFQSGKESAARLRERIVLHRADSKSSKLGDDELDQLRQAIAGVSRGSATRVDRQ
ncbi:hypothetical protein [Cryobacterium arcticum]|uniref:hypothetical protein n=1 Tax=Cryobacterium arcticum TaxID=670052 RepID=UPI0011B531E4|nr:hypothetical protein [Cryobacterium arcticum]